MPPITDILRMDVDFQTNTVRMVMKSGPPQILQVENLHVSADHRYDSGLPRTKRQWDEFKVGFSYNRREFP